ncbi:MAG: IclR family transcriptional regulator [Betaproteobacteria bacterium]
MSSLERMLAILDLFSESSSVWSVDEIAAHFTYTRSTAYRYVRELADAGLLTQAENARYSLGPRILHLDRQLRESEPLLKAMQALEPRLPRWSDEQIWLLCRVYRDTVTCIHQVGQLRQGVSFSRGYPMPLFRGATSKAILAFLPERQYTHLYLDHPELVRDAGLGSNWTEFKSSLRQIRQNGYAVSVGEVDADVFGIAAPVFGAGRKVIGSLSLVRPAARLAKVRWEAESKAIVDIGARLSQAALEPAVGGAIRKLAPVARPRTLS